MKRIYKIMSVFLCICLALSCYVKTYAQEASPRAPVGPPQDYGTYAVLDKNQDLWVWGTIDLGKGSITLSNDMSVPGTRSPVKVLDHVKSYSIHPDSSMVAAIKTDGSLWIFGESSVGQLGLGNVEKVVSPQKVMDNVQNIYMNHSFSAAIKTDGSLWMWGVNQFGSFGTKESFIQYEPMKIMDDVKEFATGYNSGAAIKTNGELWVWGYNQGQFGPVDADSIFDHAIEPKKIADHVIDVSLSPSNLGFVKSDHTLWMSGSNSMGGLGDGTQEDKTTPIKVMENVSEIYLGENSSVTYAKTTNSELYRWGLYYSMGNPSPEGSIKPEKIMENVKCVKRFVIGEGIITNNNDLYTQGINYKGLVKVLSNVKDFYKGIGTSVATKTDNTYWTWGVNVLDQLQGKLDPTTNVETIDTPTQFTLTETTPMTFRDVPKGAWFYDAVNYISSKGIMTGMREGYFGATENLSRAQFATLLYRMAGEEKVPYEKKYKDVPQGTFFTDAVMWASSNGIITGYTEGPKKGYFGASDNMTREQMAVMMYRYAKYAGLDTSTKVDLSKFPDGKKTSAFAKEAMEWAVGVGLISGNDNGTLAPQGNVSRAVCATIIMRFLEA